MSRPAPPRIAVITGANSGIGKECARLLAMRAGSAALTTVVLACRNETKAQEAKHDLEQLTGRSIFHVVLMDVADPASVRAAIPLLPPSIDLLIMNAGGVSPLIVTPTGATCTPTGVTQMTADNLLGHAVLLEGLLQAGRLTTAAVYLGSEAACGVPKLGMAKPVFVSSSTAEFVSVLDGTFFRQHKADQLLHYGQVKLLAALWMAALARRHPQLRLLTISPGNTSGTGAVNKLPWIMRILVKCAHTTNTQHTSLGRMGAAISPCRRLTRSS